MGRAQASPRTQASPEAASTSRPGSSRPAADTTLSGRPPSGSDGAPHPGPARAPLPAAIRAALVAHARAELPNEACGLIAGTAPAAEGGTATRWFATRNRAASPFRYEVDADDLLRASIAIDDAGEIIWGIVHSHVRSSARPSPTDVGLAFYPDALYLLVSLAEDQAEPATGAESVRAWRIVDGAVFEVVLDPA